MDKTANLILRLGVAFAFLYPAIDALFDPTSWFSYFPQFLRGLAPEPVLLHGFGLLEVFAECRRRGYLAGYRYLRLRRLSGCLSRPVDSCGRGGACGRRVAYRQTRHIRMKKTGTLVLLVIIAVLALVAWQWRNSPLWGQLLGGTPPPTATSTSTVAPDPGRQPQVYEKS